MKDPYETKISFTNQEKCKHGYIKPSCKECFDPYEAQGSPLRVHHPVQPKTQVERWEEEKVANINAIQNCSCVYDGTYFFCLKQGSDNCNERKKKNNWLGDRIAEEHTNACNFDEKKGAICTKDHRAENKVYLNRNATGEFADDKCFNCEGSSEKMWLNKGKCVVCWKNVDKNWKKVTLLDKIKKLLWRK